MERAQSSQAVGHLLGGSALDCRKSDKNFRCRAGSLGQRFRGSRRVLGPVWGARIRCALARDRDCRQNASFCTPHVDQKRRGSGRPTAELVQCDRNASSLVLRHTAGADHPSDEDLGGRGPGEGEGEACLPVPARVRRERRRWNGKVGDRTGCIRKRDLAKRPPGSTPSPPSTATRCSSAPARPGSTSTSTSNSSPTRSRRRQRDETTHHARGCDRDPRDRTVRIGVREHDRRAGRGGEFFFKLSTRSIARPGTVAFTFKNVGHVAHDFKINGKKTPLIQPGYTARLVVTFKKTGKYPSLCTVLGHAAAGMRGLFAVR
jgi:plastocyanin